MFFTHTLDPILLSLGPVSIRWYGIMYALSFLAGYAYLNHTRAFTRIQLDSLLTHLFLGVILGGRLGYALFYRPDYFFANPAELFAIWHGGMSFHGGLLGVILALFLFSRRHRLSFLSVTDSLTLPAAFGLALGRIGNFINAELIGRPTSGTWGVIYPHLDTVPRHPSQLYAAAKDLLLAALLAPFTSTRTGVRSFAFLFLYGLFRFFVENYRSPVDGYIGPFTTGQAYSLPLILLGLCGLLYLGAASVKRQHT